MVCVYKTNYSINLSSYTYFKPCTEIMDELRYGKRMSHVFGIPNRVTGLKFYPRQF